MSNVRVPLNPVRTGRHGEQLPKMWDFKDKDNEAKNTHLWLVNNATRAIHKQLENVDARARLLHDLVAPNAIPKESATADQIRQALVDADEKSEYAWGIWLAHFYNPRTGENWFGLGETARSMAVKFYRSSLDERAHGQTEKAAYQLGLALHFFGDATQPMHAGNFTNAIFPVMGHAAFETAAITWQNEVTVPAWTSPANRSLDPGTHVDYAAETALKLWFELRPIVEKIMNTLHSPYIDTSKALDTFLPAKPIVIRALTKAVPAVADFLWLWICETSAMAHWGQEGDLAIAVRSADGRTQPAIVRVDAPNEATWHIRKAIDDGTPVDVPIPGGVHPNRYLQSGNFAALGAGVRLVACDIGSGEWTFFDDRGSTVKQVRLPFGIPVIAQFTRLGEDQIGTFFNGVWTIHDLRDGTTVTRQFGEPTDLPLPGHYFGRHQLAVPAVWRPRNKTWYVQNGGELQFGETGDALVPGYYDKSGKLIPAVYRARTRTWHISGGLSGAGHPREVALGAEGDRPVPGDYFGDGITRPAVWRPSTGMWIVEPDLEPKQASRS